jgi:hypothetical protein
LFLSVGNKPFKNKKEVNEMKMEKFLRALREDDFGIGDSFRLGNFEFEVVGKRGPNRVVDDDEPIFRQVATGRSFASRIGDNHPGIRFAGGFFNAPENDTATNDVLGELERAALYRLVSGG